MFVRRWKFVRYLFFV